jgi:hypothetical protein
MRTLLTLCTVAAGLCWSAGCTVRHVEPTTQPQQLTDAQQDFEAVWQASRSVLGRYRFQLDRQDRRAGVITTLPMTGAYVLEPWRRDAVRPVDLGESTVQTIYRTARVTIRPSRPEAKTYDAQVEVLLTRSDRSTLDVTSTSDAYSLFTLGGGRKARERTPMGAAGLPGQGDLVSLGHDRALEAKLTAEIAAACGRVKDEGD